MFQVLFIFIFLVFLFIFPFIQLRSHFGFLPNFNIVLHYSAENPNWHTESDGRWFTSRVISRIKSNLVQTKGGPYCLEGKMNFQLAFSYGTPQFILSAFKSGFPEKWDMYREQWRKFTKQQRGMNIFSWIVVSNLEISQFHLLVNFDFCFSIVST